MARLHHGKPGKPQREHSRHQAQRGRNTRPARHTGMQKPCGAQHPQAAANNPQGGQRLVNPAQRPRRSTQGDAGCTHGERTGLAISAQPPPLPRTSRHERQHYQRERHRGWVEKRWQQNGQQDKSGDDTL